MIKRQKCNILFIGWLILAVKNKTKILKKFIFTEKVVEWVPQVNLNTSIFGSPWILVKIKASISIFIKTVNIHYFTFLNMFPKERKSGNFYQNSEISYSKNDKNQSVNSFSK